MNYVQSPTVIVVVGSLEIKFGLLQFRTRSREL